MTVSRYVAHAQNIVSRSVNTDLKDSSAAVDRNSKELESNQIAQKKEEEEYKRLQAEAAEKSHHGFFGGLVKAIGISDGGEADAKLDAQNKGAQLDKTVNQGTLTRESQKDLTARFSEVLDAGEKMNSSIDKALKMVGEVRQGE